MTKKLTQLFVIAALTASQFACGGGSGGGGSEANASNMNSRLAVAGNYAGSVAAVGTNVVTLVNEVEQGGQDLNSDGDTADNVLFVVNTLTETSQSLNMAGSVGLISNDNVVAFGMPEFAQGGIDRNADGDAGDTLLAIFDPAMPVSPSNPMVFPFAMALGTSLRASGDYVAVAADELASNMDLNADGVLDDNVIQVINTQTMTVFNTAFPTLDASFQIANSVLAFTVDETSHGVGMMGAAIDLNGNMSTSDTLLYAADLVASMVVPVGPGFSRTVLPGHYAIFGSTANPLIAYAIDEASDGSGNLNNTALVLDTDTSDSVAAIFELVSQTETLPGMGLAVDGSRLRGSSTRVVFSIDETANGDLGIDLNQDGDAMDRVPFWVADTDLATAVNVGIAQDDGTSGLPSVSGDVMVFLAQESDQGPNGTNYNQTFGDTDTTDTVFFFQSMVVGASAPTNLNFAGDEAVCVSGTNGFLVLSVSEAANDSDFNQDGDTSDEVSYFQRVANGQLIPGTTIVPVFGNIAVVDCGTTARFVAFSHETSTPSFGDVNKDGDFDDVIAITVQMDKATGGMIGIEVLGSVEDNVGMNEFPYLLSETLVVYPTGEGTINTGVDLNGDSDKFDSVLQIGRLSCP